MIADTELVAIPELLQVLGSSLDVFAWTRVASPQNEEHRLLQLRNSWCFRDLAAWVKSSKLLEPLEPRASEAASIELNLVEIVLLLEQSNCTVW